MGKNKKNKKELEKNFMMMNAKSHDAGVDADALVDTDAVVNEDAVIDEGRDPSSDDAQSAGAVREKRRQILLDLMKDPGYKPLRFKELVYLLNVDDHDKEELFSILTELENQFLIIKSNNNRYMLPPKTIKVGSYIGNKRGFGFVTVEGEEEDYFVHDRNSLNAFHGDTVVIRTDLKKKGPRKEAEIIRIIGHGITEVLGIYEAQDGYGFVIPNNKKIADDIFVPYKHANHAVSGNIVVVRIRDYGDNKKSPTGEVTEILGHINDPSSDIMQVVRTFNLPVEFPEAVEEQLKSIPDHVTEEEMVGRRDMRDLPTVTIDGEDAKDLDDAITISFDGEVYHLGVHIADVSHYVTEGSPLDKEALNRGTSCYLVDSVIPMIPHQLSNGICSLNHGEDRLCLSCLMDIDRSGKVISHEIVEGLINVDERMNYTDVAAILEQKEDAPVERYSALIPMFETMRDLSKIIRGAREKRGSIDFDIAETQIIVDENHKPISIQAHDRNVATKLIEDFMLAANETIAEEFFWQEMPFEYRVHETPTQEKVDKLRMFIRNFGLYFKVGRDKIHPKEFQKLLHDIEGQPYEALISKMTLRSMQQARYSTECSGHFGLGCKYYCHFTSPIRRYPDLQIHRIIKDYLHGELDGERRKHYEKILSKVAEDNSLKERRATEAERDVDKLKEIEYMQMHIGEEFDGVISGFTSMNIFVELENTVEGAVGVDELRDDYYNYYEDQYMMIGERTKKKYQLGDRVRIKVEECDKVERTISFSFVTDEEE